jgi:AIR synthase-related protein
MSRVPDLGGLAERLAALPGLRGKTDIQAAAAGFDHQPFPALGVAAALGDDAALLPAQGGPLLLACEGLQPELVEEDPWFAGWSAVLVNLSDIAAMGGTPLAVVNSLWCRSPEKAAPLLKGMAHACATFAVPMVGGHTNLHSPYDALSVAVLGVAGERLLSARSARPGDGCRLLIQTDGHFHRHYPFWDAATRADPELLRRQLGLPARLAARNLCHGAKDISMGGLVGTAAMFCEAAGCGLDLRMEAIEPPAGVNLELWLRCFPSFGFLLATDSGLEPEQAAQQEIERKEALAPFAGLLCVEIGRFTQRGKPLRLLQGNEARVVWHPGSGLTGFGALP